MEFNEFFKEFKEKNKGKWASVINGMDIDEETLKNEGLSEKQEEIEMLQEFERRRKFKSAFEAAEEVENENPSVDDKFKIKPNRNAKKDSEASANTDTALRADPENGELWDYK